MYEPLTSRTSTSRLAAAAPAAAPSASNKQQQQLQLILHFQHAVHHANTLFSQIAACNPCPNTKQPCKLAAASLNNTR